MRALNLWVERHRQALVDLRAAEDQLDVMRRVFDLMLTILTAEQLAQMEKILQGLEQRPDK
jgi:hypothetical protein